MGKRKRKQIKFSKRKRVVKKQDVHTEKKPDQRVVVVGTYEKSRNFGFVVPDGKKVDTDIFISKKNTKGARNGQKVLVELTKQPFQNRKAEGKVI